jgi:osmotically-inducible protein OsmY
MTSENTPHRLAARIKDRLAADARTVEFGIDVDVCGDVVVLRGQVATARRRALIEAVARESAAGLRIANDVIVVERPPQDKGKSTGKGGPPW